MRAFIMATSVSALNCNTAWRDAPSSLRAIGDDELGAVLDAFLIQVAATGWLTVGLEPITSTTSGIARRLLVGHRAGAHPLEQRSDRGAWHKPRAWSTLLSRSRWHQFLKQVGLSFEPLAEPKPASACLPCRRESAPDRGRTASASSQLASRERIAQLSGSHSEVAALGTPGFASAARSGAGGGARSRSRSALWTHRRP